MCVCVCKGENSIVFYRYIRPINVFLIKTMVPLRHMRINMNMEHSSNHVYLEVMWVMNNISSVIKKAETLRIASECGIVY